MTRLECQAKQPLLKRALTGFDNTEMKIANSANVVGNNRKNGYEAQAVNLWNKNLSSGRDPGKMA